MKKYSIQISYVAVKNVKKYITRVDISIDEKSPLS